MSLKVDNIVKTYGSCRAVDGLSFEMKEPGVFALLGTNGAGKTTSIRIILGMLSADSGSVTWHGKKFVTAAYYAVGSEVAEQRLDTRARRNCNESEVLQKIFKRRSS